MERTISAKGRLVDGTARNITFPRSPGRQGAGLSTRRPPWPKGDFKPKAPGGPPA